MRVSAISVGGARLRGRFRWSRGRCLRGREKAVGRAHGLFRFSVQRWFCLVPGEIDGSGRVGEKNYSLLPIPYLMASLRALPAVNFGTLEAAMFIFSLVWGLMPCRASRFWT